VQVAPAHTFLVEDKKMKLDQDLLKQIIGESLNGLINEEGNIGVEEEAGEMSAVKTNMQQMQQQLADLQQKNQDLVQNLSSLEGILAQKDGEINDLKNRLEHQSAGAKETVPPSQETPATEQGKIAGQMMEETFKISKNKLDEIIKEEMLFAKKQGIL
jgi:predicted RNase H-like nuclease (RuvC/YqgF family)